jgi:hypothetical protein
MTKKVLRYTLTILWCLLVLLSMGSSIQTGINYFRTRKSLSSFRCTLERVDLLPGQDSAEVLLGLKCAQSGRVPLRILELSFTVYLDGASVSAYGARVGNVLVTDEANLDLTTEIPSLSWAKVREARKQGETTWHLRGRIRLEFPFHHTQLLVPLSAEYQGE